MSNISVSVIIPVFNRRSCCKDAVRILKNQTIKNIEFIIIDDGSTDGTYEYLMQRTKTDKRFKIYKLKQNSGPSVARNIGLKHCHGQYIGFFDIDDNIPKNYFELLYKTAHNVNADIVFTTYNDIPHRNIGMFDKLCDKISLLHNGAVWNKLFQRDVVLNNAILFPGGLYCADNVFCFKAFYYAKTVVTCNTPSYQYTLSNDSISKDTEKAEKRKSDILKISKIIVNFVKTNSFDTKEREQTYHFLRRTFNSYVYGQKFNQKFLDTLLEIQPNNTINTPINTRGKNMLWLKIKKHLGLCKNIDKIILLNEIRSSGLFDEGWYLQKYPDVATAKSNPIQHYLEYGWKEGRNPSPRFDNDAYLFDNPDVANAGMCPLLHYIRHGQSEGRYVRSVSNESNITKHQQIDKNVYKTIKKSKLFDKHWYLKTYPDVKKAKINPIKHYIKHGAAEERNPSRYFDTKYYLNTYADVKESGMNPLFHYIKYGYVEGRSIRTVYGKILTHRSFKQKLQYAWAYPIRVHDEYLQLKNEIKQLKNSK